MQTEPIRELLKLKLEQKQHKNPSFSLRAYAYYLDVSPGALSEILNGKRKLTAKTAIKFIQRLDLTPELRMSLLRKLLKCQY